MNWISVNDKLPRKLDKVLFHWICPGGNKNISMGYLCDEGWDIYLPYHSYKMCPGRLKVTHWAELPNYPAYEPGNMDLDEKTKEIAGKLPTLVHT